MYVCFFVFFYRNKRETLVCFLTLDAVEHLLKLYKQIGVLVNWKVADVENLLEDVDVRKTMTIV
jgi:hypothetical protein